MRRPIDEQRGDSGFPDICFAGRGRVGFIECKMPKNKRGDIHTSAMIRWNGIAMYRERNYTMAQILGMASDDGMIFRIREYAITR